MILFDNNDIKELIREVFGTDEDLCTRRHHGEVKTLDGLVDYAMDSLFDGVGSVTVFYYGDRLGFAAIDLGIPLIRSFGIKKEHRDKKHLFWEAVEDVVGEKYYAAVWSDNRNARRFFEEHDGVLMSEMGGGVLYEFKNKNICR